MKPEPPSSSGPSPAPPPVPVVRLVTTLIHDVRNALNNLSLEAADLRERLAAEGTEADTRRLQDLIRASSDQLRAVRERLEPGPARPAEVEAAALWDALGESMRQTFAGQGQRRLQWGNASRLLGTARLDTEAMKRALEALVENALEAGGEDPVEAEATVAGKALEILIVNSCPEPPEGIADWGSQAGCTRKRRRLGLGCWLAARIAEAHGGQATWRWDAGTRRVEARLEIPVEIRAESAIGAEKKKN